MEMVEPGFLDACKVLERRMAASIKKGVNPLFKWHQPLRAGLEMEVVGSGSPAPGSVVETTEGIVVPHEVQHVLVAAPDGLGDVSGT